VAGRAHPILVQSVGTKFSAPRPVAAAAEQSFVVLILRDMDPDEIATIHPSLPIRVVVLGRH
jgi:hypothetical protein